MKTNCYIHEQQEEVTGTSTVCFECKHAYPDEAAILAAWVAMWADTYNMTIEHATNDLIKRNRNNIEAVTYCPLCLHDW